jgi:hypothetical protein
VPRLEYVKRLQPRENADLTSLVGLESIVKIGELSVTGPTVENLEGLSGVVEIERLLAVRDASGLKSLSGLTSLTDIGESLAVGCHMFDHGPCNPDLVEVSLPALRRVGADPAAPASQWLSIRDTDELTTVELPSLTEVHGHFGISYNASLPTCTATAIAEQLTVAHEIVIEHNLPDACEP